MQLGLIGLGKMGLNMAIRLLRRGHAVVGTAKSAPSLDALAGAGGTPVRDISSLVAALPSPRAVWVMVPSGEATESVLGELSERLAPADVVVDGGNSYYRDSIRRAESFASKGIGYLDAGTSGGIWGLENGYCLMVGGPGDAVRALEPVLRDLAPPDGFLHTGPSGSGHFAKMVHNGIEYGMMQAYGEGFEILQKSRFSYDHAKLADLWNHGSVVRSWLLELAADAFRKDGRLDGIRGYVQDSGEGRWTVQEAMDLDVPAPVLTLALQARFVSRQEESFSAKVCAALRNEFGGHAVKPTE